MEEEDVLAVSAWVLRFLHQMEAAFKKNALPNDAAKLFAAVDFIMQYQIGCPLEPYTVKMKKDHGWPCPRNYNKEVATYRCDDKTLALSILKDSKSLFICLEFPPAASDYFLIDVDTNSIPFYAADHETSVSRIEEAYDEIPPCSYHQTTANQVKVTTRSRSKNIEISRKSSFEGSKIRNNTRTSTSKKGKAKMSEFQLGLSAEKIRQLYNRLCERLIHVCNDGNIPKDKYSLALFNFQAIPDFGGKNLRSELYKKFEKLYTKVEQKNEGSVLMGTLVVLFRDNLLCDFPELAFTYWSWPIAGDYNGDVIEFYSGERFFSLSLIDGHQSFYLVIRNDYNYVIAAKKIPKIIIPSFGTGSKEISIDVVRLSVLSVWTAVLFNDVMEGKKDVISDDSPTSSRSSSRGRYSL